MCDPALGSFTLDPALTVDQVDMDHAAVDATLVPADAQQEIVVALPVEDKLTVDFSVGIWVFRILSEYPLNNRGIPFYSGIR
jgi:hypothetical protein